MQDVILGTMTWGPSAQVKFPEAVKQLEAFVAQGGKIIDTARMYQYGETEELIGQIFEQRPDLASKVQVHTKAQPLISKMDKEGLTAQIDASLKALRRPFVEVYYIHNPDVRVPLLETLKALDELYKQGKFKELGLSAYAAWDVVYAHYLCVQHGLSIRPTVYQGCMNAITRTMEPELMPTVRTLNMRCYVYNPLAGGMLTGRYTSVDQQVESGRFSKEFDFLPASMQDHPFKGKGYQHYRSRYWKQDTFDALTVIRKACEQSNLTMVEASIIWLLKHSTLRMDKGDGIIFGASSVNHVESNMKAVAKAHAGSTLSPEILKTLDEISESVSQESYFRGYDAVPGKATEYLKKF